MKNIFKIKNKVMWIELTQGQWTCIDLADWPLVSDYRWCAQKNNHGYRVTTERQHKTILLHQLLAGDGVHLVDHKNGNPLDNRRRNLRLCNQAQNALNRKQRSLRNTSGYKGVSEHKPSGLWKTYITVRGKQTHLGYFETKEMAAQVYNMMAIKLHGAFARLNSVRTLSSRHNNQFRLKVSNRHNLIDFTA